MDMVFMPPQQDDLMQNVRVPEVFDEHNMAQDLVRLASNPTAIGQYLAQAGIRFTQKQQIKVLKKWTERYNAGEEVIKARTAMARAYGEYTQVNAEAQLAARKKEVDMANLDADYEEALLRTTEAKNTHEGLNRKEPPRLTAEQERVLRKDEIQKTIERLERERDLRLKTIEEHERRIRTQNMYDDQIARQEEQLQRYL